MIINLDELYRMRTAALSGGVGSKAWINFAVAMIEAFPVIYQTAAAMNLQAVDHQVALRNLIAQIELHTDCMDGRIDRAALDEQMDAAERLVGCWPDFTPPAEDKLSVAPA